MPSINQKNVTVTLDAPQNVKVTEFTKHNLGVATMQCLDEVRARVLGIPGPKGEDGDGGSGGGSYTNFTPVPETIGGIEAGSTFDDEPLTGMQDKLLYPFQFPAFTSFSIQGQSTTLEVGQAVTGGIRTFQWNTSNQENIIDDDIKIIQGFTVLINGTANDGSEDLDIGSDIVKTSATSQRWSIETHNTQFDTFSRNFNVNWRWRVHYGNHLNPSLIEADVLALSNSLLATGYARTYNFPAQEGYKYICYPTSFGLYSKADDPDTGFQVAMQAPVILSVMNSHGVATDYYINRTTNVINGEINIRLS
ncbi:MAG TPA: hypothetical protein ENK70_01125 [Methylophaga sp.]|nr:hypothetical protein [Methylophaga sp.]